jgi:alcohol dehydrogenase class IV
MNPFRLELPPAIHFGAGSFDTLREIAAGFGSRVLVVSGSSWLAGSAWGGRLDRMLHGRTVRTLGCAPGEPSTESLAAAAQEAAAFGPDLIVAIGGGSVIDTAKALSALVRWPGKVERFLEGVEGAIPVPGVCLPWVAVPTTAGTGAEVTKNAVVRVTSMGVKRSMRSAHLLARAVVVDPELAVSLPLSVTGTSGLDALTQLVEAYVTRASNPFVRSIIEGALPGMVEALGRLPESLADVGLRSMAAYGALVSGISLANAGLGAAHGFAAAVGGMFDVPHGLACAVFLPHVLEANAPVIDEAITRLVSGLPGGRGAPDRVEWLGAEVRRLLSLYGLPQDLRERQIPPGNLGRLAELSAGSSMRGNPRELSLEERTAILSKVV